MNKMFKQFLAIVVASAMVFLVVNFPVVNADWIQGQQPSQGVTAFSACAECCVCPTIGNGNGSPVTWTAVWQESNQHGVPTGSPPHFLDITINIPNPDGLTYRTYQQLGVQFDSQPETRYVYVGDSGVQVRVVIQGWGSFAGGGNVLVVLQPLCTCVCIPCPDCGAPCGDDCIPCPDCGAPCGDDCIPCPDCGAPCGDDCIPCPDCGAPCGDDCIPCPDCGAPCGDDCIPCPDCGAPCGDDCIPCPDCGAPCGDDCIPCPYEHCDEECVEGCNIAHFICVVCRRCTTCNKCICPALCSVCNNHPCTCCDCNPLECCPDCCELDYCCECNCQCNGAIQPDRRPQNINQENNQASPRTGDLASAAPLAAALLTLSSLLSGLFLNKRRKEGKQ